jgi:signal transduction histidine kinase
VETSIANDLVRESQDASSRSERNLTLFIVLIVVAAVVIILLGSLVARSILRSIQQLRFALDDAHRARTEAVAGSNAKSLFVTQMSHEIRTPMNGVIASCLLLINTELSEEQAELVHIIRNSGASLLMLINDILDLSKIEAGRLELDPRPFDLRSCIEGALDVISNKCAEKRLELAYNASLNLPVRIFGDDHRLRQILVNLLSNAVRFVSFFFSVLPAYV